MNCKPGDLAYIVASDFPENIGAVVEVVKLAPPDPPFPQEWECRPCSLLLGWDDKTGRVSLSSSSIDVCDISLRPISGVPVHDEEHDEVTA